MLTYVSYGGCAICYSARLSTLSLGAQLMTIVRPDYFPPVTTVRETGAEQAAFVAEFGGYDPESNTFVPFRVEPYGIEREDSGSVPMLIDMLQNIAVATHGGLIDDQSWPHQLFATPAMFESFLEHLSDYEDTYRIPDFCWSALVALTYDPDLGRADMLAERLVDTARELETDGVELWPGL